MVKERLIMNKQTRVTPVESKQEEKNPMDVDVQVILQDYRKQVSDLEWAGKIKDAQIKNLQQALQEAKNKIAKLDKPVKVDKK